MKTPRDKSIGAQMHIASALLRKKMHAKIHKLGHDSTIEQLSVLEVLLFSGPLIMSEIASMLVKENAVITRMIDVMEHKGFVRREPKPGDRRAYFVSITEAGKNEFEILIPHLKEGLIEATSTLTKEEYEEGMRIIKKIIKHNNTE